MTTKQELAHVGLRLPIKTKLLIIKMAAKEGRNFSNMVIHLLNQALNRKQ